MAKNKTNWTPDVLPKELSETRAAAAIWLYAIQYDLEPLKKVCADKGIAMKDDLEVGKIQPVLKKCFPEADIAQAKAMVKRESPYEDITDELLDEVMATTHTEGYELIPWREAVLRILAIDFMASPKSSSAQLSEDAISRVTAVDDKLRGTTKNACQFISGQRTRLRKAIRMLAVAMLYHMQYRKEMTLENIQADVMQLVKTCPDPDFVCDEFPFEGFTSDNGEINARGRYAFCETVKVVREINAKRDEIDEIIQNSSKRWRISRMSLIDLNILRLAAYELCFEHISAPRVLINEAVELAKLFGAEQSKNFVNGILQQLCNDNNIEVA